MQQNEILKLRSGFSSENACLGSVWEKIQIKPSTGNKLSQSNNKIIWSVTLSLSIDIWKKMIKIPLT